jgi:hypothetical protein
MSSMTGVLSPSLPLQAQRANGGWISNFSALPCDRITGQPASQVFPESPKKFFSKAVHAQISFVTDAQGHATSLTLHQDGDEHSAKRIDKAEAGRVAGQLAKRIKDGTPQAGSEGAVRRSIESLQAGQPNYDEMTPALAEAARQQLAYLKRSQDQLGQLQSISFRGVSPGGWDVYEVRFANGISIWRIALARDGKIAGMLFQTGP